MRPFLVKLDDGCDYAEPKFLASVPARHSLRCSPWPNTISSNAETTGGLAVQRRPRQLVNLPNGRTIKFIDSIASLILTTHHPEPQPVKSRTQLTHSAGEGSAPLPFRVSHQGSGNLILQSRSEVIVCSRGETLPVGYSTNIQSPYEKNLYLSRTACSYARSTFSRPAKAETSMSSVDLGK